MKRGLTCSISVAVLLIATATWVSAATMYDIDRSWGVYSKAKGKVSKLGSDHSEGVGSVTITANSPSSGSFHYIDARGYDYTGSVTLSPDGKKLAMQLNGPGRTEFENMMADWIEDAALWEGLCLDVTEFIYDKQDIVISPVKISKKTNAPIKGNVSAKGTVWAELCTGGLISGNFSFKSTITFLP